MRGPLRLVLVAMLAAGLCLSATAAPQRKPDAAIKTRTIDAGVGIDPALKAYPGLYPRLLTAGQREMNKWRVDADKDFRENPQLFRDGRSYEFGRSCELRSAIQGYVSVVLTDYSYGGGAHPNHFVDTLLWDTKAKKFISVRPFFKETRTNGPTLLTLATAIRNAVVADKMARGQSEKEANDPMWVGDIKPDLTKIGGIALAPSTEQDKSSGFIVYFQPYAVGAYVEGFYIEFVPWTVFKTHLSDAGARLFGGTRPPGDAKHDEQ